MLKELIKTNRNARKIFGKKELEIIMKQLDGMPLSQSERNQLSRDIKPKFEFIKEASKFQDEFKLIKNQENKKIIEEAVKVILQDKLKENIKAILLFGSFADKSYTQRSDIDICAVFKTDLPLKEATEFRIRIAGSLPNKLDIQVFNILPQNIKKSVARNHKVLYSGPTYDNIDFTIYYLKDDDYVIRLEKIFGAEA